MLLGDCSKCFQNGNAAQPPEEDSSEKQDLHTSRIRWLGRIRSSCSFCQIFAILWASMQWRVPRIHTVGRAKKWLLKQGATYRRITPLHCCIVGNGSTNEISRGLRRMEHAGKAVISNAQVACTYSSYSRHKDHKGKRSTWNSYRHRFAYLVLQRPHHRAHGKQQSGNVAVQGSGFGGLNTGIFGKASAFNAKFNLKSVSDPSAQIEVS